MAFIDEIRIHLKAGDGGNGVVRWLHEKGKEFMGPAGGNGGKGGDVYVVGIRDLQGLGRFRHIKELAATKGDDGMRNSMHGKDGTDLEVQLPVGTLVTNETNGRTYEVTAEGQKILILEGGKGGKGNEMFKSSTNQSPDQFTEGKPGAEGEFFFELQLAIDAGFIGFPNAGKSSLLNALTRARAKVGAYPFTTIEPNLGDLYGFVLGDIPGLIEGASEGKGLGHTFLRHIRKTKVLVHCVSLENENVPEAYETIRSELKAYEPAMMDKPEIIILTKTDVTTPDVVATAEEYFTKQGKQVMSATILDNDKVKEVSDTIVKVLRALEAKS